MNVKRNSHIESIVKVYNLSLLKSMLKYLNTKVTFAEVPDEITLCINITGCKNGCKNCHSPYLAEDIGEPLYASTISQLIHKNKGITCVVFMGGDSEPSEINVLAKFIKDNSYLKVAWYSGRSKLSKDIDLENFDYIKLGPYIEELGPLNSRETNQRLYEVMADITYKFWEDN